MTRRLNNGTGGGACVVDATCGKHGKCHHGKCKCDEGYTDKFCDDKIDYEIKLVVAKIDTKTRNSAGCEKDIDKLLDDLEDEDNKDKLKLNTVTVLEVPTECGDGKSLDEKSIIGDRRLRLLKKDDKKEAIVVGVVLVDSSTRSVNDEDCMINLDKVADHLSKHLKPKELEKLDGSVVYVEADEDCDEASVERILKD